MGGVESQRSDFTGDLSQEHSSTCCLPTWPNHSVPLTGHVDRRVLTQIRKPSPLLWQMCSANNTRGRYENTFNDIHLTSPSLKKPISNSALNTCCILSGTLRYWFCLIASIFTERIVRWTAPLQETHTVICVRASNTAFHISTTTPLADANRYQSANIFEQLGLLSFNEPRAIFSSHHMNHIYEST